MANAPRPITLAALSLISALIAPVTASATAVVTLTDRLATVWTAYGCGGGVEWSSGADGSTTPADGLQPRRIDIQGAAHFEGVHYVWHCDLDYHVWQRHAVSGSPTAMSALKGSGAVVLNIAGEGTLGIDAVDHQVLEFSVTEATPYRLVGSAHGGHSVGLRVWSPSAHRWGVLFNDFRETDFDVSGTLQPGRYQTWTHPYPFTADGTPWQMNATWQFTLSFPGAATGPVSCGDFQDQAAGTDLGSRFKAGGFKFKRQDGSHSVVLHGADPAGSLAHGASAGSGVMRITPRLPARQLMLWLLPSGGAVTLRALASDGSELTQALLQADGYLQWQTLASATTPIASLEVSGGDGGTVLARVCSVE